MLVLTRKVRESVMIDEDIQVIVLGMNGDNIILGFNAPYAIPIHRQEVYLRNKSVKLMHTQKGNFKSVPQEKK